MLHSLFPVLGLFLGLTLSISTTTVAHAQWQKEKPAPAAKQKRLNGTIHSVSKETSSFSMRRGTDERNVVYTHDTTITYQNEPSSAD